MFMIVRHILAGMDEIRRRALKGRGAISNESSRFERERRVLVDDGWEEEGGRRSGLRRRWSGMIRRGR